MHRLHFTKVLYNNINIKHNLNKKKLFINLSKGQELVRFSALHQIKSYNPRLEKIYRQFP